MKINIISHRLSIMIGQKTTLCLLLQYLENVGPTGLFLWYFMVRSTLMQS